jgi:hypothetical protein
VHTGLLDIANFYLFEGMGKNSLNPFDLRPDVVAIERLIKQFPSHLEAQEFGKFVVDKAMALDELAVTFQRYQQTQYP